MGSPPGRGLLLLAALLAACGPSAVPAPTSSAPATTFRVATPEPTPTLQLRTPQPPPSAAAATDVLVSERSSDIPSPYAPDLLVTADGRLLAGDGARGMTVRRLTPSGVELLRRTALDTGLFTTSRQLERPPMPGVSPNMNRGFVYVHVTVRDQGRDIRVTAAARDGEDALYRPTPERDALLRLADRLADLSWLPSSAWADPAARPYVATFHRLYIRTASDQSSSPMVAVPVSDVWPFVTDPGRFGIAVALDPSMPSNYAGRCAILTADDARALGEGIARTNGDGYHPERSITSGDYRWPSGSGEVHLQLEPLLPDVSPTCEGVRPWS